MRQFGPVVVDRIRSSADLRRLLPHILLESDIFIVKPTWYSPHLGNFTDAETLRLLIEALDGRVVVTESYTLDRQDGTMKFAVDGKEVDWIWVLKHQGWDWIRREGRWDELRRQDKWFLDEYGFTDLFKERGVEYINVSEEVWQGRTADAGAVKEAVKAPFTRVFRDVLYSSVPERLYELRGAPLISFGKVKGIQGTYPSLTMKNLFGLIPDPNRAWWHGPNDKWLGGSIVDINKVYSSLFNVYGICEALRYATVSHPEGEVKVPWGSYNLVRDPGIVTLGQPLIYVDAVLCGLIGVDPEKVSYLRLGEEAFGRYERRWLEEAKAATSDWFPV